MLLSLKQKSPKHPLLEIAPIICLIGIFSFTYFGGAQDAVGQINGGGTIDAGDFGGPTDGGDFGGTDIGGDFGIGGGTSAGTGAGVGADAFGEGFGDVLGGGETEDVRNQGFVGATSTRIQENGFVGPVGSVSADGADFGGGINNVETGGAVGGGRNNQNQNTGFGGTGQVKGFEIFRSNVRANLRRQFSSPQVSGYQVADRFQNRIRRLPNMASDGAGVQITIDNQTATMHGFVGSVEESQRIQRQLRLEPGVYRINNQTRIIGQ